MSRPSRPARGRGPGRTCPSATGRASRFRSAMRFAIPAGFAGWTSVDSATLSFYIERPLPRRRRSTRPSTSGVGRPRGRRRRARRTASSGFSSSNTSGYSDIADDGDRAGVALDRAPPRTPRRRSPSPASSSTCRRTGTPRSSSSSTRSTPVDYAEIWSMEKAGKVASLTINYDGPEPAERADRHAPRRRRGRRQPDPDAVVGPQRPAGRPAGRCRHRVLPTAWARAP